MHKIFGNLHIANILIRVVVNFIIILGSKAHSVTFNYYDNGIVIFGEILPKDDKVFESFLNAATKTIFLSSIGGHPPTAMAVGKIIRNRHLSTVVVNNDICASSCALIWLAGQPALLGPDSKIGLHSAYLKYDDNFIEEDKVTNLLIRDYLNWLGYSANVANYATQAAPNSMKWLSQEDADNLHIAYGIIPDENARKATLYDTIPQPFVRSKVSR